MNAEIRKKYDTILHLSEEVRLPRDEVVQAAKNLFTEFTDTAFYDKVLGDYEIELYHQARGKGLTIEESAHCAEVSHYVMQKALQGIGLSIEKFVQLAKAELFARAQMITKLLNILEKAESSTDVNAATILLEKIAPNQYGKGATLGDKDSGSKQAPVINFTVREDDE
jgi:hypothetical protein